MSTDTTKEKEIAFYSACVSAWIETRMERDRVLVSLSAAGIGLLITLATTAHPRPFWILWLYMGALACFLVSVVSCVVVFEKNAAFLQSLIKEGKSSELKLLTSLDALALRSFGLAIIFAVAIGVVASIQSQTAGATP